jgi:hypothetical protein
MCNAKKKQKEKKTIERTQWYGINLNTNDW